MANDFGLGHDGVPASALTIIVVFIAISFYNVIELNCIIWATFKRHAGLYFWSFLICTWGIASYSAGFLSKYYFPPSQALGYFACTLIVVGWVCMVSGQSMVLWSRLHLVLRSQKRLKIVLYMIIVDGIICHGAIIPMVYGSFSSHPEIWAMPYSIMEKIQVTVFFLQELILSSFYIVETLKMMKLERSVGNHRSSRRRLVNDLVLINVIIIILDVTILGLEYANQYNVQTSYKGFVYSVKLKLEFTVLNRLVKMTTQRSKDSSNGQQTRDYTSAHKSRAVLESFVGDVDGKPAGGYRAYAVGGDGDEITPTSSARKQNGVVMMTEIVVQRGETGDGDTASIKSSTDTIGGAKGDRSKTSSEVEIATRGF